MEQSDLYLLQSVPPYHLQALVKARRLPYSFKAQQSMTGTDPSSMTIMEVGQLLFDPTSCRDAIRGLTEMERSILRELVACGGRANSRDLALYLSRVNPPLDDTHKPNPEGTSTSKAAVALSSTHNQSMPPKYPTPHPHGVYEQALHRLLLLGLLFWGKQTNFVGRDYASGVYDGVLIVPQAVLEAANELWNAGEASSVHVSTPEQESGEDKEADHVSGVVSEGIRALQRDLYRYWSLVAAMRDGMPLVNKRMLSRPALRQIVDQLSPTETSIIEQIRTEADIPHLLFIRLLLIKLGLLSEQRGILYATPAETFFSLTLLDRARRCYRLWLDTPFWNELVYLPDVAVRPGPAPLDPVHDEVVRSRKLVVERLLAEPAGVLYELPTFIAPTKLYIPYLLFPRQYGARTERYSAGSNPYGWDFRLKRGWLTPREGWYLVEGGFIRAIVTGPMHWLGMVDLDQEESPGTFRQVPGVATIMSKDPIRDQEIPWGRLIVQPNFELVALAPVSEVSLVSLDRFAERVSLEHIAQYRLTKSSVTRAIQKGLHAETIQAELERAAGGEIPQNVRYSLVEWERQARRVEVWQSATLLEVADAGLLDMLFANQETRPLFGRRLSPVLVEVMPQQLATVQEVLWKRDYLPALTDVPAQDVATESGRLTVREPQ